MNIDFVMGLAMGGGGVGLVTMVVNDARAHWKSCAKLDEYLSQHWRDRCIAASSGRELERNSSFPKTDNCYIFAGDAMSGGTGHARCIACGGVFGEDDLVTHKCIADGECFFEMGRGIDD
jgi:hypothetical protein